MAFSRKLLNDGEEIVLDLHPHWFFFWKHTLTLVAALALGVAMLMVDVWFLQIAAGVLVVAALVWFLARYLDWISTNFVVTTDRLIYRHGVLAKRGIEIPLDRVNNVLFGQNPLERVLGAGDLTIESAGESGQQNFSDVKDPVSVQNEIYRQIEANENRKYDRIHQGLAGSHSGASIPDELRKLDDLRRDGVLTEDEFAAQKRKLLGS